jgi:two-component system chemotaxis response regulator CheY
VEKPFPASGSQSKVKEDLKEMRALEELKGIDSTHGARIIMTTALGDVKNVAAAYKALCDGYLVKPVDKAKLLGLLDELKVPEKRIL